MSLQFWIEFQSLLYHLYFRWIYWVRLNNQIYTYLALKTNYTGVKMLLGISTGCMYEVLIQLVFTLGYCIILTAGWGHCTILTADAVCRFVWRGGWEIGVTHYYTHNSSVLGDSLQDDKSRITGAEGTQQGLTPQNHRAGLELLNRSRSRVPTAGLL